MMKAIFQILLIALGMLFNPVNKRVVEETYNMKGKEILELDFKFADEIRLTTWDKNHVSVKVFVSINENQDNDKFQLLVEEDSESLIITEKINNMEQLVKTQFVIEEDEEGRRIINGQHSQMEIVYEVLLPENVALKLETISGDILVFSHMQSAAVKSISGFIDYSVPASQDVDFELSTISGEMFSNLDLAIEGESDRLRHIGGQDLVAILNDGGDKVRLKTISGNIYLRRKE